MAHSSHDRVLHGSHSCWLCRNFGSVAGRDNRIQRDEAQQCERFGVLVTIAATPSNCCKGVQQLCQPLRSTLQYCKTGHSQHARGRKNKKLDQVVGRAPSCLLCLQICIATSILLFTSCLHPSSSTRSACKSCKEVLLQKASHKNKDAHHEPASMVPGYFLHDHRNLLKV